MGMSRLTVEVRGQEVMLVLYFCPRRVISAAIPMILHCYPSCSPLTALTVVSTQLMVSQENQFYLLICSSIFSLLTHFKAY